MSGENDTPAETGCGCDGEKRKRMERTAKMRSAPRNRPRGGEVFKGVVRDLSCLCRDQFGRVYPCPCEPSGTASTPPTPRT